MNVYNINPNKSAAKHARERQSDRIRKSINYLINECSDKLNFRDKRIDLALSKISKVNRLLPEIHYLHHLLQAAMRLQDPIQVRTSLLKLIDAICTDPDENEWISISSLSDSEWEKFIVIEAKRLTNQDLGKEAGMDMSAFSAKVFHFVDCGLKNASSCSAPACMTCSYNLNFRIIEEHRATIGCHNSKVESFNICYQAIAFKFFDACRHYRVDFCSMHCV